MAWWQLLIYAVVSFIMSVLSGIAGAGGGFIMTPLSIFLGLSPAQAVASGKFNGLAVTIGSLSGLRGHGLTIRKGRVAAIMFLALLVGLIVPFIIKGLDSQAYRIIIGLLILGMVPVMFIKKVGLTTKTPTRTKKAIGGALLALSLFLQGAFSGGLGALVNIVLMSLLGMTATEANITKRWSQVILNITIIIGVIGSNYIMWSVVAAGVITCTSGGYIGGKMALKRGDEFIMKIMLYLMVASGLALIVSAI